MRILFTAMTDNIHTARWINQLSGLGWDIHIFGDNGGVHPDLHDVTVYKPMPRGKSAPKGVKVAYWWPLSRGEHFLKTRLGALGAALLPDTAARLAHLIDKIKPDCIHTLKMQPYGYQVLAARDLLGGALPAPWLYSSWGRDTAMYRHRPDHLPLLQAAMSAIDYYIADTQRDVPIAYELGFRGEFLGVFPGSGGFDLDAMNAHRQPGPPSARRKIAVKGYQTDDGGQVMTALRALQRVSDLLHDYTIVVQGGIGTYGGRNYALVRQLADEIVAQTQIRIKFLPFVPHEQIWQLFGSSRIGLSISRSDGTPVTMLEWMIMGAFPIESDTGGPGEWIEPGINGDIVPFDDVDRIASALRRALRDDPLVDRAAERNAEIARDRLDRGVIQPRVIDLYRRIQDSRRERLHR